MQAGQVLGAVLAAGGLAAAPAQEGAARFDQLQHRPAAPLAGFGSGQALGAEQPAAGHRPVFAGDQIGPLAGQGFGQLQHRIGQLGIADDDLPGRCQQLGGGFQHCRPPLGQGGSVAKQQVFHPLGPFIQHHHSPAPFAGADP